MHDDEENCLTVKWMTCRPAPDKVRMLIPNFYTEMLFQSCADIKHHFELYMWTSTDFLHIIFYYRY